MIWHFTHLCRSHMSWSPESPVTSKCGLRYDCWILIMSSVSSCLASFLWRTSRTIVSDFLAILSVWVCRKCLGTTSDIHARPFMYLQRILLIKITKFRLSDWMSEMLGRKVEMGIFSRSMGENLSTVGGGMRALTAIILYMWCNFAWLSDLTSLTDFLLSTLSAIICTHSPASSHLWSGIRWRSSISLTIWRTALYERVIFRWLRRVNTCVHNKYMHLYW